MYLLVTNQTEQGVERGGGNDKAVTATQLNLTGTTLATETQRGTTDSCKNLLMIDLLTMFQCFLEIPPWSQD